MEKSKQSNTNNRVRILITSPLEPECVETIATAYPDHTEVIYRPDLLPEPRYKGDHVGSPNWKRSAQQELEWQKLLEGSEVLWDIPFRHPESALAGTKGIRWIQTTSAGVGPLVQRIGLQDRNIIITTASGVHAQPLAEFVFATLLFHSKGIAHLQSEQSKHRWERFCGKELAGQTMTIIGPGRIGREVARIAKTFRMNVTAMARDNTPERAKRLGVDLLFSRDNLKDVLADSDCVVLCAPHTPETEGLFGREEFDAIKEGAVFVNIARGAMVVEEDLISALNKGRISFAGLDVFDAEPLPDTSPLWDMPNVLISPHSASTVESENSKITEIFIRNLGHYLSQDYSSMEPVLDKSRLY